ncbi:MAG: hypothetical protein IAE78_33455 [Myxococcus sp.]|nr:hypothetical protein [Myxococcus sp.]
MVTVMLSLLLAAGDADEVAALVKRAQAFAVKPEATWAEAHYFEYSDGVAAWRKQARALQERPTLTRRDAVKLLEAHRRVVENYRALLAVQPVPKSMTALGEQAVAVWKDSISKWMRALDAEAAALKEEARRRASSR